jgi:hypothetical protein
MVTSTSRQPGQTGARGIISGVISSGATWWEDLELTEDGTVITSADTWTWRMTFRESGNEDSIALTLSTTDGTLTISQGADATTIQIRVVYTALSAMEGDYICDLASLDTSTTPDKLVHWAHGVVTFRNEPIWSS